MTALPKEHILAHAITWQSIERNARGDDLSLALSLGQNVQGMNHPHFRALFIVLTFPISRPML